MGLGKLRFRLRIGNRIVGYQREVNGGPYYSKDLFWWTGTPIDHEERDAFLEIRDKNDRPLFDGDVVRARWRASGEERRVHLRLTGDWLEAFDIDEQTSLPGDRVREAKSLEFLGFSFDDEASR